MKRKLQKFQIIEYFSEINPAGKAPMDFINIGKKLGFQLIEFNLTSPKKNIYDKVKSRINYVNKWKQFYKKVPSDSIILIQLPNTIYKFNKFEKLEKLKKEKNVHIIAVIHDINQLRGYKDDKIFNKEMSFVINSAEKIIVHNTNMRKYFERLGVNASRLIDLKIFDYILCEDNTKKIMFSRVVNIAGNLDDKKAGYLKKIKSLDVSFNLFGINYNLEKAKNISYKGNFPSEEIPNILNTGFGLIWDGNSLTECNGLYGEYLKYNSPFKLSLYLAAGLPVIIWSKAAQASFVEQNKVGLVVDSLYDLSEKLSNLSEAEYFELVNNVKVVSSKLRTGYYTTKAIEKAVEEIGEKK